MGYYSKNRIHVCPVETGIELLGGKWKPRILWKLHQNGTMRFGELKKQLKGVTQKMLTQQLRQLENDGLIVRKVYAEVPPKVEYSFSEFGKTLKPILDAMADWGTENQEQILRILEGEKQLQSKTNGKGA